MRWPISWATENGRRHSRRGLMKAPLFTRIDFKSPTRSASMSSSSPRPLRGTRSRMEVEFGQIENFHGQFTARRVRGSQPVGFLPDTLLGNVRRFEFARVVQGRFALLRSSRSFSKSSREGFCPEIVGRTRAVGPRAFH